jgi:hypothetical protein
MSMSNFRLAFGGVLLAANLAGCSGTPTALVLDARFEAHKHLFASIDAAGPITVYEGLPSGLLEEDLFQREKANKATLDLAGDLFYPAPLAIGAEDMASLKAILRESESFTRYIPNKCEFHADYAVEWGGGPVHRCHLCFHCGEVKIYTTANRGLLCSMTDLTRSRLIALLKPYRTARPGNLRGINKPGEGP